jgi:hypothetical protein
MIAGIVNGNIEITGYLTSFSKSCRNQLCVAERLKNNDTFKIKLTQLYTLVNKVNPVFLSILLFTASNKVLGVFISISQRYV